MNDSVAPVGHGFRNYLVVTLAYWAFTITDGAIHMLVVLHFYQLGYRPLEIAFMFLFYEVFGIITNGVGGVVASRLGLNTTMVVGMVVQIVALALLAVDPDWLSVGYVMTLMAGSGIAKDLNKMSAKSSVKLLVPEGADSRLFRWVALLTGSKNSLKGAGFFLGGALLAWGGFRMALVILAGGLTIALLATMILLPGNLGKVKEKVKISQLFSRTREINLLAGARFFLFGSRDVWFTVGLPVYCSSVLGWSHTGVGTFLAAWVIGYGVVQASAPAWLRTPDGPAARQWAVVLALLPAGIVWAMEQSFDPATVLVGGLIVFGAVFALNSSLHSCLILVYSNRDKVAMNVGFYYMANAAGRLTGTVLSGWLYQVSGLAACLWVSTAFILLAWLLSWGLPDRESWEQRRAS